MDRLRHRTKLRDTAHKSVFRWFYVESKRETSVAKAKDYIGEIRKVDRKYNNSVAPSCKLKLARFSA